jgi:hypothetical protein
MKLSKITAALALSAAAAVGVSASAATITNADGALTPFGGFDWASGGAAWTNGLAAAENAANFNGLGQCINLAACSFSINYVAWAGNLTQPGGATLGAPGLDSDPNGVLNAGKSYEYTIKATLSATLLQFVPGIAAIYSVGTGTFSIYYDTTGNANLNDGGTGVWTGFGNGIKIIEGDWATPTPELFNLFNGSGNISLVGAVTFTDTNYVNPALVGTNVSSTLQLWPSQQITNFTPPVSVDGVALPNVQVNGPEALFQADANQAFTTVPEPTSMVLAGLALLGAGVVSRRRRQAQA